MRRKAKMKISHRKESLHRMKKLAASVLLLALVASMCACKGPQPESRDDTASSAVYSGISVIEDDEVSSGHDTDTDQTDSDDVQAHSFIGALSEKQKEEIIDFAELWYKENFAEYEVLSMDFAEDDDSDYGYYSEMKPGEIIILMVHTTHGSKKTADGIEGIPRRFVIKITDSGYEMLNEGY